MSPFPLNNESQQEPDYILAAKSAIKFLVDSAPKIYNLFSKSNNKTNNITSDRAFNPDLSASEPIHLSNNSIVLLAVLVPVLCVLVFFGFFVAFKLKKVSKAKSKIRTASVEMSLNLDQIYVIDNRYAECQTQIRTARVEMSPNLDQIYAVDNRYAGCQTQINFNKDDLPLNSIERLSDRDLINVHAD